MTRRTAVDSVVQALLDRVRLRHMPGDLLANERQIAEDLGVSRNTVREALIHLEALGIVEKTQRGPRVRAPGLEFPFHVLDHHFDRSLKTCQDLLNFRRILETGLMPAVVARVERGDIARLESQVRAMEGAMTARHAAEADHAFHSEILRIAENGVAITLYRVLAQTLVFYMEIGKHNAENSERTAAGHRAIIAALAEGSAQAAAAALCDHYDYSEANLLRAFMKTAPEEAQKGRDT
jgi:GntR family transcriptional regulator, transcriptional repressor for pyruvate dehydrogenase complex